MGIRNLVRVHLKNLLNKMKNPTYFCLFLFPKPMRSDRNAIKCFSLILDHLRSCEILPEQSLKNPTLPGSCGISALVWIRGLVTKQIPRYTVRWLLHKTTPTCSITLTGGSMWPMIPFMANFPDCPTSWGLEGYSLQGTALEPKMRQFQRSFSGYQLMDKDPQVDQQQHM